MEELEAKFRELEEKFKALDEKVRHATEDIRILNNNYRFDIARVFGEIDRINGIGGDNNEGV